MTRNDPSRTIIAPTGTTLTAKSWLTEAPLRMLMNNLHPDVAERPQELVVYAASAAPRAIGRALMPSSKPSSAWTTTRPCWCSRASRSACSAPMWMRRAC